MVHSINCKAKSLSNISALRTVAMIKVAVPVICLWLLAITGLASCQDLPVNYSVQATLGLSALPGVCPSTQNLRANIKQDLNLLIRNSILPLLSDENITQIPGNTGYGACSCGGPGWRKIANLNMSDPAQTCPPAWELIASPRRSCGIPSNAGGQACYSAIFSTQGVQYSRVCGRIVGYQIGQPEAFVLENLGNPQSIDGAYIDGVSLTYGSPRQHIWSFAAALDESASTYRSSCPCTNVNNPNPINVPAFIGTDYFCETGVPTGEVWTNSFFYANDPLWDGQGCGPSSTCCTFNNPPWFCKRLSQSTNADLEMRICGVGSPQFENTPIELAEIYIM